MLLYFLADARAPGTQLVTDTIARRNETVLEPMRRGFDSMLDARRNAIGTPADVTTAIFEATSLRHLGARARGVVGGHVLPPVISSRAHHGREPPARWVR